MMFVPWTFWDYALFFGVLMMVTAISVIRAPRIKALLVCVPVPFFLADMAVDRPVGAPVAFGFLYLAVFAVAVMLLHYRARVPVIPSVILAVSLYVLLAEITQHIPLPGFWASCGFVLTLSTVYLVFVPHPHEHPHPHPLSIWKKLPVLALTVAVLITTKKQLEGFIITFPLVSLISAVEMRHALRTLSRQIVYAQYAFLSMLAGIYATQMRLPKIWSLAAGLVAFGCVFVLLLAIAHRKIKNDEKIIAEIHGAT